MESSGSPFSSSSLLCHEGEDNLLQEDYYEDTAIHPGFDLDNDQYIEFLFQKELEFVSQSLPLSSHDMSIRLKSLEWIFNVGFLTFIVVLIVFALVLASFLNQFFKVLTFIVIQAQEILGLQVHTAYLSVTYFDRFFSKRSINVIETQPWGVQLLSLGCLSLAAKMEEQKVPSLCDYPVTDYIFKCKTIQDMELLILSCLDWKMGAVTPFAYLHYFVKKFCGQSKPEAIVSRAMEHVLAITKDVNLINHRSSIIASAAILAAFDGTLTRQTMNHRISVIPSWGSLESEHVFSCYNLMQQLGRRKTKNTPASDLLSTHSSSAAVTESSSLTSALKAKRKLNFKDSEDFPVHKVHRS